MTKVKAGYPAHNKEEALARVREAAKPYVQAVEKHGTVAGIGCLTVHKSDGQSHNEE